mmetsp:Transcript_24967/g.45202  ORF Transcript_24967/g.45202 Transcript_24967/m.45202 type:complete len:85 (-) Transcript_24967:1244-1498(-)
MISPPFCLCIPDGIQLDVACNSLVPDFIDAEVPPDSNEPERRIADLMGMLEPLPSSDDVPDVDETEPDSRPLSDPCDCPMTDGK